MTSRTPTAAGARIATVVEPVVRAAGYDLEQVSVATVGRRAVVRVVIDKDGGVSLDDAADVSRAVSAALDTDESQRSFADLSAYTLEVTSPGVDRPLTEPRHWRRAAGRLVRTRIGSTPVHGRIVSADDVHVILDVDGAPRTVPYADLGRGSVLVEFAHRDSAGP